MKADPCKCPFVHHCMCCLYNIFALATVCSLPQLQGCVTPFVVNMAVVYMRQSLSARPLLICLSAIVAALMNFRLYCLIACY